VQLLINLTIRVPPQPAQEREPSRAEALVSGAGGCGLPLEPVLDVLPARWASDLCQLACYDLRDEWQVANPLIEEISTGKSGSVYRWKEVAIAIAAFA